MTLHTSVDGLALAASALAAAAATVAMVAARLRRGRPSGEAGEGLLAASFAAALLALLWRWMCSGSLWTPPLGGLGEVFAVMGMLVWPVGVACRRRCGAPVGLLDALWALALLIPAAFVFPARETLAPVLRSGYFAPHVLACLLGYLLGFKAAAAAGRVLTARGTLAALCAAENTALIRPALAALTIGLALGSAWGRAAWGDWWNWDPKELLTLAAWCALAAALAFSPGRPRRAAAATLAAAALMLITLTWANLSRVLGGLHAYA